MRTKKHIILNILRTVIFSFCLILLATCDVGLGPSVDTTAPNISITSPTPSQVVKGSFSMGGVATDDGGIANIIVDFTGIGSSEGTNYNFEASVADGKWSLSVNSVGSVADGTYQLKVTANDKSGKTSYQMTTFTVDNTAPVILVTSPDEKNSSMNYDLQFEGKIYDATEIDKVTVTVYDEAGNAKISKEASLVGTSEWKVSWDGETELLIGTALAKLANGDYTYSVTASDKVGNSSTYFFHKEDIYKEYNKNKLSIDAWAAFDKGDTNSVSDVVLDRTWLNTIRIPADPAAAFADRTKITYSEKQIASISWDIETKDSGNLSQLDSATGTITGTITPPTGVDSPFKNDTFVAYIWKEEEGSNNAAHIHSDADIVLHYDPTDTSPSENKTVTIENIGTSRKFTIRLKNLNDGNGLGKGKHGIYIQISNSSNQTFSDEQAFGIDLGAPKLEIPGIKTLPTATNTETFSYSGTAFESDGNTACTQLKYKLTITSPDGTTLYETSDAGLPITVNDDGTWTHSVSSDVYRRLNEAGEEITATEMADGTYAYEFIATSGDYEKKLSHTLDLDKTGPEIITGFDDQLSYNARTITISVNCSDNLSGLREVAWYPFDSSIGEHGAYLEDDDHKNLANGRNTEITFNTDGSGYKIKFVAIDKSGNRTEKEYTGITIDSLPPTLKDKDASNSPILAASAPNFITSSSESSFKIITATNSAVVVAEDVIAIDSFEVKATRDGVPQKPSGNADDGESWYSLTGLSNTEIKKQLTVGDLSIPDFTGVGDGRWVVTVNVKDKSGWTASKTYSFTVDTTPPEVDSIETIDAPKDMGTISYLFSGTANDIDPDTGSGVKKIEVAFTNKDEAIVEDAANEEDNTPIKTASGQADWNYSLVFSENSVFATEGEKTIHVRAIDTAGNVGEWTSSNFVYDKSSPTSSIISYKQDGDAAFTTLPSSSFYTGKQFTLKGKVSDSQGIASVEVWRKNGNAESTSDPEKIATITESDLSARDADGMQYWTAPANLPTVTTADALGNSIVTLVDGSYTFYAIAMDKSGVKYDAIMNNTDPDNKTAGKTTTSSLITVTVDTTAPTVEITSPEEITSTDYIERTGLSSLSGSSYIFSVNTIDAPGTPGADVAGAAELKYVFVKAKADDFGNDYEVDGNGDYVLDENQNLIPKPENNPAVPDIPALADWEPMSITDGSRSITQGVTDGVGSTAANSVCDTGTLNEGHWYLFVQASDKAGNVSEIKRVHFHVDMKAPTLSNVTVDSVTAKDNATYYTKENTFTIAGKATDTYGIKNVVINEVIGEDNESLIATVTPAADGTWNYTYTVPDGASDTAKDIKITATDYAGKTVSKEYVLYKDTEPPTIEATSPAKGESLSSTSIKLKGSAADDGSGVASVSYTIKKDDTILSYGSTSATDGTDENGKPVYKIQLKGESWTVDGAKDEQGKALGIPLGNEEGTFTLIVSAVDKVGNATDDDEIDENAEDESSNKTHQNKFFIDRFSPTITEDGIGAGGLTTNTTFTFSGFVYDTNALDPVSTVVITADNDSFTPVTFALGELTPATTSERAQFEDLTDNEIPCYKWSQTFVVDGTTPASDQIHLEDGTYVFTITATDEAGKTKVQQRRIQVDTSAPEFAPIATVESVDKYISYKDNGTDGDLWHKTSVVTLTVKVADAETGSGLSTVEYLTEDNKTGFFGKATGDDAPANGWSAAIPLNEGTNHLKIKATDVAGNVKIYPDVWEVIKVDTQIPTVEFDSSSDILTNGEFTINVTAKDGEASDVASGLASGLVSDNGETYVTYKITKTDEETPRKTINVSFDDMTGFYSCTFDPAAEADSLEDGVYNVTVTAKDNAENSITINRRVTIDKTAPIFTANTLDITTEDCTGTDGNIWYGSSSLDITGSLTELNGIQSIYWAWMPENPSNANPAPMPEENAYRSLDRTESGSTYTYNGTLPVSDSCSGKKFVIKAVDKAGNVSTIISDGINVDLQTPVITVLEPSETPLLNGQKDLTVKVEAMDSHSGINAIKLKVGDMSFSAPDVSVEHDGTEGKGEDSQYTLVIDKNLIKELDVQAVVYIQAEDKTGRTSVTTFQFKIDKDPPTAEITAPTSGDVLNKEISFVGRANDDQNLLIVNLYYSVAGTAPGDPDESNVWKRPMPTAEEMEGKTDEQIEQLKRELETASLPAETIAAQTKWVLFKTFEGAKGYNWDEKIDTTDDRYNNPLQETDEHGNQIEVSHIHFMAEAFDAALNSEAKSRAVTSYTIDQFSDCPVITFSNIAANDHGLLKSTQTVYGTIEDDDGAVKELRVSNTLNGNWDNSDSTACTVRNGSWSYTDTGMTDGDKVLYFRVVDAKNNVFITPPEENATVNDLLRGIYISGTEANPVSEMKALKFRIDMNPPQINQQSFRYITYKAGDPIPANYDSSADYLAGTSEFKNDLVLGGTNDRVDFFASAFDANGIKSMSIKLGNHLVEGVSTGLKDSVGNDIYRMSGFDISKGSIADGTQTLTITAFDSTDSDNSITLKVRIDNTAPTFQVTSHQTEKDKKVTGSVTLRGTTSDAIAGLSYKDESNNDVIIPQKFMIPTKVNAPHITGNLDVEDWNDMTSMGSSSSWRIDFDGVIDNVNGTNNPPLLKEFSNDTYATKELNDQGVETGRWIVPVYFRTEDIMGNYYVYDDFYFLVDPDGDKPSAEVTYPTDGAKLGGSIRLFGKAEDNENVDAVYIQIDVDGDGNFTDADKADLSAHYTIVQDSESTPFKPYDIDNDGKLKQIASWGIEVDGNRSWNFTINSSGEFDPANNNNNDKIKVRCVAKDNNGLLGNWSESVQITIDVNAPRIGSTEPLKLVQYDASGKATAMQDYQADASIKGKWYLSGSAEDGNGIKNIVISNGNNTTDIVGDIQIRTQLNADGTSSWTDWDDSQKTQDSVPVIFRIPIDTENKGSGNLSFDLTVTENTTSNSLSTKQTVSVKYDNAAPTISEQLKHNTANIIGNGENGTTVIEQSNLVYSIEGTVSDGDGGSGFSRIAIYFKRTGTGTDDAVRVYNPAIGKDEEDNRTDIDGSNVELKSNLPVYTAAVNRNGENSLELTSGMNSNIRKGGLVKLGGVYRLITGVSGNTVTFTPSVSTTHKEAEFVYALVVDNFKIETARYTGPGGSMNIHDIANDDGDGIIESIEKNGTDYEWSVSIDSKNIPDGPIDICCVAFDNADNISSLRTVSTSVQNNRPAIANIWLGTDYDQSDKEEGDHRSETVTEDEFINIRSVITTEANWKTNTNASNIGLIDKSSSFKAVGKTVIKPEIIGGNGTLNYWYAKDSSVTSSYELLDNIAPGDSISSGTKAYVDYVSSNTKPIVLTLSGNDENTKLDTLGNGDHTIYFKIWDSTENLTGSADSMGSNTSQWASFAVKFNVKVVDTEPPTASIKRFYWNSSSNNSLYQNSTANGHIELEDDWKNSSGYNKWRDPDYEWLEENSKPEYDADPKVSGIIKIEGTAFDETCLRSISIKAEGFTALSDFTTLATFSGGTWTATETSPVGNLTENGYQFFVKNGSAGVTSAGHSVEWELDLDTSFVSGVVSLDRTVYVKAEDCGGNTNYRKKGAASDLTAPNPDTREYRMDIVPYIKSVENTVLSRLKPKNPSVYARTALGHYSVASTETDIVIKGFNLSSIRANAKEITISMVGRTSGIYNHDVTYVQNGETVHVYSLNNCNNNDSKGGYTGTVNLTETPTGDYEKYKQYYYNRQPNNDNNNFLTDDVEFDIWQITSNAVQPKKGVVSQPVMAINPVNHDIGFAFVNGSLSFSMPNSGYSYDYSLGGIDYWTSIGLVYDSMGYAYATTAGGDINASVADQFRIMTSRWGRADLNRDGYNYGTNQLRLELIGQADFEKTSPTATTWYAYSTLDKERIISPSIATANATSDSTTVYLAYYDNINDEIRFKWGDFKETRADTWDNSWASDVKTKTLFGDYYGKNTSEAGDKTVVNDANHNATSYAKYRLNHNSLIAGQTKNKVIDTNGKYYNTTANGNGTAVMTNETTPKPVYAGKYVSIAAIENGGSSDDAVVAVWWDGTNNQMLYSYNKTPKSIQAGKYLQADTGWSTPVKIFDDTEKYGETGEYCKIAVDKNNHVHIAAYDGLNTNVCYAYIDAYDHPENAKTCIVDSYGSIGTELNIDVALDDNNPVPYISYYAGSVAKPKIAYWAGKTSLSALTDSAKDEVFTGSWEVSIIPTESRVSIDHVNVGLWKDANGKITWSTTDGKDPDEGGTVGTNSYVGSANSENASYGNVWGNGTKNPVLGYAITSGNSGYVETAQMK